MISWEIIFLTRGEIYVIKQKRVKVVEMQRKDSLDEGQQNASKKKKERELKLPCCEQVHLFYKSAKE